MDSEGGSTENTLAIDRMTEFDIYELYHGVGKASIDWRTWAEQNEQAFCLLAVDVSQILLLDTLRESEQTISSSQRLIRLKDQGYIMADLCVFRSLWRNKEKIPESWKGSLEKPLYVYCQQPFRVGLDFYFVCFHFDWISGHWEAHYWGILDRVGKYSPTAVLPKNYA